MGRRKPPPTLAEAEGEASPSRPPIPRTHAHTATDAHALTLMHTTHWRPHSRAQLFADLIDAADVLRLFLEQQHVWGGEGGGQRRVGGRSPTPSPAECFNHPQRQPHSRTHVPSGPYTLPPSPGTSHPSPTTPQRDHRIYSFLPPPPPYAAAIPQRPPHRWRWRWRPDTRSPPPHNRVSRNEPPSRSLHAPPPPPLRAHPHPQHPKSPPAPPGLDLPAIAQLPQAHATQATNPPAMHLRPQRTAACHRYGHTRGCPGAPGPRRRRAGGTPQPGPPASGAAWAARVRARGALGMTGVRGGTRGRRGEDCGAGPCTPPPGSARYRPGSEAAASPHAVWQRRRAPRPRPAGPAPSARSRPMLAAEHAVVALQGTL